MTIHKDVQLTDWNPQTRAVILELDQLFPGFTWGTYGGHDPTEARAGDAMVPGYTTAAGIAKGTELADWLWANRERYNLWYEIWRSRIRSRTYEGSGWTTYRPTKAAIEASPDSAYHRNHVHWSTYPQTAKAYGTVWLDRLQPGVTGSDSVAIVQRALGITPASGDYDSATAAAVQAFQAGVLGDSGSAADGVLGKWQTAELLRRTKTWATLRLDPSGQPAAPPPVVEEPPVVVVPPPDVVEYPRPTSGEVYLDKLQPGVTGSDSVAYVQDWLERAVGTDLVRTGAYDTATQAAAKAYQRDKLGDAPEYADGVLGKLQTISLAKAAGAAVTIYQDSAKGGQVWPELPEDPKPPTPPKPQGAVVRVATWNVYVDNSLANMKAGLRELDQAGVDAVGLQELSDDAKMKGLRDYARSIGWASTSRNSAVTIMWNTETTTLVRQGWTLVDKGGWTWEAGAGGTKAKYKGIMETVLRDKESGREWSLLNHHLVATVESGGRFRADKPKRVRVFKSQIAAARRRLESYASGGRMVAVTADWNVAWGTPAADWVKAQLAGVGATVNWDEAPDQDTHAGSGVRAIDWVAVRNGKLIGTRRLGRHNSDHYAVAVDIGI